MWTTILLSAVVGCRTRPTTSTLGQAPPSRNEIVGVKLEINKSAFKSSKFSLQAHLGNLQLWNMVSTAHLATELSDDWMTKKIKARILPLHLGTPTTVSNKDLRGLSGAITATTTETSLLLSGMPGTSDIPSATAAPNATLPNIKKGKPLSKSIEIQTQLDRHYINSQQISNGLFNSCPTTFFADDGPFYEHLKANSEKSKVIIETAGSESGAPTVEKITVHPRGITWQLHCTYAISWNDIDTTKVMAELYFELTLEGDTVIFPRAQSVQSEIIQSSAGLVTENGDFGTRFQKDYNATDLNSAPLYHWNPQRAPIVIDDMDSIMGKSLSNTEHGQWLKEGIKIATADLRNKFPAFGNRIYLRSEKPLLTPTIAFSVEDSDENSGTDFLMFDDKTGEMQQAQIIIGHRYNSFGHARMLERFAENGLLDNTTRAIKETFLTMVMSQLGGALGLRPNYAGYGAQNNWGNDLQSVMSFAELAIPMEFLTDKIEWKDHDILSLKILYSRIDSETNSTRAETIAKVMSFSLGGDELLIQNRVTAQWQPFLRALTFFETTIHPQVARFRSANPDWKSKIENIYLEVYGMENP